VRAASGIAPLGDGWIVVSDDGTHAAWLRGESVRRVRVLPPVDGHDLFDEASGTKHRKPDLIEGDAVEVADADLTPVYLAVAGALGLPPKDLNLEGACLVGSALRWFQRGHGQRVPSASIDVELAALLAALDVGDLPVRVPVGNARIHDLGEIAGIACPSPTR
jgi:hypothetical protein